MPLHHVFLFCCIPYEAFWFRYKCWTFNFFDRTSYFVGYIGCNVPFWNVFSDILELGTYSECYCFVIPIIILVSTFCVLLCLEWFAQSFKEVCRTYFQVSVSSVKTFSKSQFCSFLSCVGSSPAEFSHIIVLSYFTAKILVKNNCMVLWLLLGIPQRQF